MPVVQVRRRGSAPRKRAAIDGVQLSWINKGPLSKPKTVSSGEHVLQWFAEGKKGQSYEFEIVQPAGTGVHVAFIFTSDGWDNDDEDFVV